jgi:hypothetical protein
MPRGYGKGSTNATWVWQKEAQMPRGYGKGSTNATWVWQRKHKCHVGMAKEAQMPRGYGKRKGGERAQSATRKPSYKQSLPEDCAYCNHTRNFRSQEFNPAFKYFMFQYQCLLYHI